MINFLRFFKEKFFTRAETFEYSDFWKRYIFNRWFIYLFRNLLDAEREFFFSLEFLKSLKHRKRFKMQCVWRIRGLNIKSSIELFLYFRCSGQKHCRYNFTTDHPSAVYWNPATLRLKYACIPGKYFFIIFL